MRRVFFARMVAAAAFLCLAAAAAVAGGAPEGSAQGAPSVEVASVSSAHISPDGDGAHAELVISPRIATGAGGAITLFEFVVFGTSHPVAGEVVWRQRIGEARRRGFWASLFGVTDEPAVTVPDELRWDATYRDSDAGPDGAAVPDGDYIYQLTIADATGATSRTPPFPVTVDREPPVIRELGADAELFSPNGDGIRDTVTIEQRGSGAVRWSAEIVNRLGNRVREFVWGDALPARLEWDGRTDAGAIALDGEYRYVLTGEDAAGNVTRSGELPIVINASTGDVQLAANTSVISPNADGVLDYALLRPMLSVTEDVAGWKLTVTPVAPGSGNTVAPVALEDSGGPPVPQALFVPAPSIFSSGAAPAPMPEGRYEVRLEVRYGNGSVVGSQALPLLVDTTPPEGSITVATVPQPTGRGEPVVFGGDSRERVELRATLLGADEWNAVLQTPDGDLRVPLETFVAAVGAEWDSDVGLPEDRRDLVTFTWEGRDARGRAMPDGEYALRFESSDEAGNRGATNTVRVAKDTRGASVGLSVDRLVISPNDDGVHDSTLITMTPIPSDGIHEVRLSVVAEDGRAVRTERRRPLFTRFEWLGRTDSGATVPDGEYTVQLEVEYRNGNRAGAQSGPLVVDTTPPAVVELSAPYRLFSPDGDGERDAVRINQQGSPESVWRGVVVDSDGRVVLERQWKGAPQSFTWDGRDRFGGVVSDGDYRYLLEATDAAGNTGRAELTLVIDTASLPVSQQPPRLSLTAEPDVFTPDGDGEDDVLVFGIAASSANEFDRWSLEIIDSLGRPVREFRGGGAPPAQLVWDGRSGSGELVRSAHEYRAELRASDVRGNAANVRTRVNVGILVRNEGATLRIMVPSIVFARGSADLFEVENGQLRRNLESLRSLAEVLRRYRDREILIEGHAGDDIPDDGPARDREQRELLALSAARAEEVRRALVVLGIERERMRIVGVGGARPLVPPDERDSSWKNRRVEFILESVE